MFTFSISIAQMKNRNKKIRVTIITRTRPWFSI
ncbi:hypothetical protein LMOATCC19117_2044 [Listeria monocytogenes ATCC 19117]|nr:hypothetical protein LMOATCC19117_2044 [Listeria monocytogenes ATCC 19117]